jgi:hypothetical protein
VDPRAGIARFASRNPAGNPSAFPCSRTGAGEISDTPPFAGGEEKQFQNAPLDAVLMVRSLHYNVAKFSFFLGPAEFLIRPATLTIPIWH